MIRGPLGLAPVVIALRACCMYKMFVQEVADVVGVLSFVAYFKFYIFLLWVLMKSSPDLLFAIFSWSC